MLRSLRFRLPALFLLGIVLTAVVATLIAVRFFQSYTRTHAATELRGESAGIVRLYEGQAGVGHVSLRNLELPLRGDRVYWIPAVPGATLLAALTLPALSVVVRYEQYLVPDTRPVSVVLVTAPTVVLFG